MPHCQQHQQLPLRPPASKKRLTSVYSMSVYGSGI